MSAPNELLTKADIANAVDVPQHRITYILRHRLDVKPSRRIANANLYEPGVLDQVRRELDRMRRTWYAARGDAPESNGHDVERVQG